MKDLAFFELKYIQNLVKKEVERVKLAKVENPSLENYLVSLELIDTKIEHAQIKLI